MVRKFPYFSNSIRRSNLITKTLYRLTGRLGGFDLKNLIRCYPNPLVRLF